MHHPLAFKVPNFS